MEAPSNTPKDKQKDTPILKKEAESDAISRTPVRLRSLLLAIVCVAVFGELGYTTVNVSAMPVYIKAIELPAEWVAWVMLSFLVAEGILKSPFGILGDRVGRKVLIIAGPLISTLTALLTPHVRQPFLLVGLRILDGMGAAALWPSAFSLIGDHVPENRRSAAMSYFNIAYLIGVALGPFLGGLIDDLARAKLYPHASAGGNGLFHHALSRLEHHLHFLGVAPVRYSFYLAAVLFLLTSLIALIVLPNDHPGGKHARVSQEFDMKAFRAMMRRMPMILLMTFITFMGIGLIMAYVKLFLMQTLDLSETEFGRMLLIPALFIAALSAPMGSLGDRLGKPLAVKIGIGTCAAAFWMMVLFLNRITLPIYGTMLGLGFVLAFPAWMALVSSLSDDSQRGAAIGAVGTSQGAGTIVGILISGFTYKLPGFKVGFLHVPEHGVPFLGCAILLLLAFAIALVAVREPQKGS